LKVGISWAGGAASTRGASRSTRLSDWAPVLGNSRCHFVSLQYGNAASELQHSTFQVNHWPEALAHYDETAALVSGLDLIISVQTALVHLAGALGTPVWVMLQAAAEWRYGETGETLPWYSSVRLIRQRKAADWRPVFEFVAAELRALQAR
jgi:ADP-heptose:LPS heptosyltransferase